MVLLIIIGFLFVFYSGVIIFYNNSWRSVPLFQPEPEKQHFIKFSVIIPARNEEQNIGRLLETIILQSYPKDLFEVIVVDDHSADRTAEIAQKYFSDHPMSLQGEVRSSNDTINSYKKKAIETGISAAQSEWIICTDADCEVPENWLATYAAFIYKNDPVFIAAPVSFSVQQWIAGAGTNQLLFIFQVLDFMTLQGITGASVFKKAHSMCNGANLAYKKDVFYEVNGFAGVDDIASGDDMLLMHKIWKRYPEKVHYLKSHQAIVQTAAAPTWKDFFNQRIRWASKAKHYDDKRIFAVLLLVYLFNCSFLVLLVAGFFNVKYLYALVVLWVLKTLVELPFITSVSKFFSRQHLLKYFFFFQPLHIAYTIFSGFLGSFGRYEWKGRKVK